MDNLKAKVEQARTAVDSYNHALQVIDWLKEVVENMQKQAQNYIEITETKIKELEEESTEKII